VAKSKAEQAEKDIKHASLLGRLGVYFRALGPGLITGASDDDPSGIGTYAQTGAQFGYTQLWMALFTFPLMTIIQEICARVALQTGTGLASVLRKSYPRPVLYFCLLLLCIANTFNLGADLGAMAAAARLLVPLPIYLWLAIITIVILMLLIFISYNSYARILRFLTLSLVAYVLVVFAVQQDYGQALRNTFIPSLQFNRAYLMNLVAVLGTTISPYLFFWQASQEVEEKVEQGETSVAARKGTSNVELKWMRTDVTVGMLLSNVVMWFIVVTAASTLFRNGIYQVDSAAKAAEALKPVAGPFAAALFAAGIVGTGALAVPVLAGSVAYAAGDTFRFREGLSRKWYQAPQFYTVIVLATLVGAGINLLNINPMMALYYSAILNGLAAPPLLLMLMLIGNNRKIMHENTNNRFTNIVGWITTVTMTMAAVALLITFSNGQ
jgi:NRAMP (natural resistance-associated macrophage protein)-like metal ion transporter